MSAAPLDTSDWSMLLVPDEDVREGDYVEKLSERLIFSISSPKLSKVGNICSLVTQINIDLILILFCSVSEEDRGLGEFQESPEQSVKGLFVPQNQHGRTTSVPLAMDIFTFKAGKRQTQGVDPGSPIT